MTILIPVLNPGPGAKGRRNPVKKKRRKAAKNPIMVHSKSGSALKQGGPAWKKAVKAAMSGKGRKLKDGRISLKVDGQQRYVQLYEHRVKSKAPKTTRAASKLRARGGAQAAVKKAAAAKKKKRAAQRKRDKAKSKRIGAKSSKDYVRKKRAKARSKRGPTRGRSFKAGTSYASRPETIKYTEAAAQSGAVYPAKYPSGHPQAGKKHPKAGRPMSLLDALSYQRPVVGFLNRTMIKKYYDILGDPRTAGRAEKKAAKDYLDTQRFGGVRLPDGTYVPNKTQNLKTKKTKSQRARVKKLLEKRGGAEVQGLEARRKKDGSAWTRVKEVYGRSGRTPRGKRYIKGRKRPDYSQYWSDDPASWQTGGGEHLRVRFRSGRGPKVRLPLYRGFGPTSSEIEMLEAGGFGGPTDSPGGRVKLNRGKRRGRRKKVRRRSKKNPHRNSKGRFVKKNRRKKTRKKARKRRRKKVKTAAYNPRRKKRRRKRKVKANRGRKRRRRNSKGRFVKSNGRRRYRRKKSTVKRNSRKRRGRKRRVRRNQGVLAPQLSELKKQGFWMQIAHVLVGMSGTALLSNALLGMGPLRQLAYGQTLGKKLGRFAVCLGSAGLLSYGAYLGRNIKLIGPRGWVNVLVGGTVYCTANLLNELFRSAFLPSISAGRANGGLPAQGMEDWMELSGMGGMGGMGSVISPYDLVAGESASRMTNEFSGMGSGYPVPIEDIRGMGDHYPGQYGGGLSDWVEAKNGMEIGHPLDLAIPETF